MDQKAYKWGFLFLLVLTLFGGPATALSADAEGNTVFLSGYVQTLYDEESIIPVSQVKCALQTSDGYMWFAGYQGLMRYNGISTRVFGPEDDFPTYNVNILFEDSRQRLWVGTNDSGLLLYHDDTFTMFSLEEGLPGASVRDIAEDAEGNIYVATAGGIAHIDTEGQLYAYPDFLNTFMLQIEYIGGGRLLTLTNDGTATIIGPQNGRQVFSADFFGPERPISLHMAKNNTLYIGTAGNSILVADGDMSWRPRSLPDRHTINSFFEDSAGRLWVCADNGIGYLEDNAFVFADGLLMNNSIELIYQDHEGNFWVCSSRQGLLQLTQSRFTNLSFAAQIPDYTVNTTAIFGGDLYIGTDVGLVVLRNNKPIENELTSLLDGIRIRCMLVDRQGWLWVCTYEQLGVLIVKPGGETVSLNADNGLTSNQVRCVIEGLDNTMIVGTSGGVNIIRGGAVVKTFRKEDGLSNDVILSLVQAENGVIYAGSDGGGVYALRDGAIVANYTEKDGLQAGVILRMALIDGGMWISTGNSICYMEDYLSKDGIIMIDKLMAYDDSIFDIRRVGEEIWFLQSKGVNICRADNLLSADPLMITQLQRRDGLSAPITANSWDALDDDGTLYICTGKGVLSVNTAFARQSSMPPFISISEVLADGKPLPLGAPLVLPSNTQRLDIYPALLSFASKDGTISYFLEGFDTDIKTVARGDAHWVSYTNLKGGDYTFHLYGANAGGEQSAEIVLPLSKKYTTFEIPLVRVFLVLLVLLLLGFFVWLFVSRWTKTVARQRQEYKEITKQAFLIIATMTDSKNEYTAGHSRRVAEYAETIGRRLGLPADELEALHFSALLHDIGKSSVPNSVLNKRSPLTSEELEIIKTHATVGGEMLRSITLVKDIALGARYHHERVDGAGYAEGLTGEDIPLTVKIISVANAFDSMCSDRPYRKALSLKEIKSEFIHNAGSQFDEKVVAALIEMIDEGMVPV